MPADNPLHGEQFPAGEQMQASAPEAEAPGASPTNALRQGEAEAFPAPGLPSPGHAGALPGLPEGLLTGGSAVPAAPPEGEWGEGSPDVAPVELAASAASGGGASGEGESLFAVQRLLAAFGGPVDGVGEGAEAESGGPSVDAAARDHAAEQGLRRRAQVAPALIALDRLEEDSTFQVRPPGDISLLATDIARVGQLFPVDVRLQGPDRFQVVCGFRRVAALRFLHREFVLARVHTDLSDEDALLMALAAAIHASPVSPGELEAARERLAGEGRLSAAARDMLEKALQPDEELAPEGVEEEVDADELAADVAQRLGAINQDLALLADVFSSLDASRRAELLMQLRYSAELVAYLEGLS